jgi:sec-independent protein translocase protein TatB
MLDIGWTELLVIAIVLIVVVGPKDLPPMLRAFGKMTSNLRKMAGEFRSQFDEALREADLDDVNSTLSDAQRLNPTNALRDAINPLRQMGQDIKADLQRATQMPNNASAVTTEEELPEAIAAGNDALDADGRKPATTVQPQPATTPSSSTAASTSPVAAAPVPAPAAAPAAAPGELTATPVRKSSARTKSRQTVTDASPVEEKPVRRRVAKPTAKPAVIAADNAPAKPASRKRTVKKTETPKDDA